MIDPWVPKTTTSDAERDYFNRVMDEAREQRGHERELAQIEADKQINLVKAKQRSYEDRMWRKYFLGWVVAGFFVFAAAGGIWAITDDVQDANRTNTFRLEQLKQETAQACIKEGNLWVDGDCFIARRDTP